MAGAAKAEIRKPVWPYRNLEELEAAGFAYNQGSFCRGHGCGAAILWFYTPRNNHIAVNADDFQPHWSTCPDAARFRRRRRATGEAQETLEQDQTRTRRKSWPPE